MPGPESPPTKDAGYKSLPVVEDIRSAYKIAGLTGNYLDGICSRSNEKDVLSFNHSGPVQIR